MRQPYTGDTVPSDLQVADAMYDQNLLLGFPVPPLIRFVGAEDAFISNAHGGPRIFFNIEDHQSYQTGTANQRFDVRLQLCCFLLGSTGMTYSRC